MVLGALLLAAGALGAFLIGWATRTALMKRRDNATFLYAARQTLHLVFDHQLRREEIDAILELSFSPRNPSFTRNVALPGPRVRKILSRKLRTEDLVCAGCGAQAAQCGFFPWDDPHPSPDKLAKVCRGNGKRCGPWSISVVPVAE